jgi:hypothetical protein
MILAYSTLIVYPLFFCFSFMGTDFALISHKQYNLWHAQTRKIRLERYEIRAAS